MSEVLFAALLFAVGVFVLVVAMCMVAVGAWWFGHAVREAHTARAHAAQADSEQATFVQAHEALAEARHAPTPRVDDGPTDDELREIIRAQRAQRFNDEDEGEHTTEGNAGFEPNPPGRDGVGIYRTLGHN